MNQNEIAVKGKCYFCRIAGWSGRRPYLSHEIVDPTWGQIAEMFSESESDGRDFGGITDVTYRPWLWDAALYSKYNRYKPMAAANDGVKIFNLHPRKVDPNPQQGIL